MQKREKYYCLQTHHLLLFLSLFPHENSGFSLCLLWHSFVLYSLFSFSLTPFLYFRCYHKLAPKLWASLPFPGSLDALTVTSALQPQKHIQPQCSPPHKVFHGPEKVLTNLRAKVTYLILAFIIV